MRIVDSGGMFDKKPPPEPVSKTKTLLCPNCGKRFKRKTNKKYCSSECKDESRGKAAAANRRPDKMPEWWLKKMRERYGK